jgi:alcohol dehydrogenase class IV
MLPVALRVNREVAEKPLAELAHAALPIGSMGDAEAADALLERIDGLCAHLKVPTKLSQVGVKPSQLDDLVQGSRGNSMNGNPRQLDDAELRAILEARL